MTNLAFFFQFHCLLIGMAFLIFCKNIPVLGMHQIEIKIVHAAGSKLLLKKRTDFFFCLKKVGRKLIGKYKGLSWIALYHTLPDRRLALTPNISFGCVKIIKSLRHILVYHPGKLLIIHFLAFHRQTHTTESEILLHFLKFTHSLPPLRATMPLPFPVTSTPIFRYVPPLRNVKSCN